MEHVVTEAQPRLLRLHSAARPMYFLEPSSGCSNLYSKFHHLCNSKRRETLATVYISHYSTTPSKYQNNTFCINCSFRSTWAVAKVMSVWIQHSSVQQVSKWRNSDRSLFLHLDTCLEKDHTTILDIVTSLHQKELFKQVSMELQQFCQSLLCYWSPIIYTASDLVNFLLPLLPFHP